LRNLGNKFEAKNCNREKQQGGVAIEGEGEENEWQKKGRAVAFWGL